MQKWKIAGIALMFCAVNGVKAQRGNYEARAQQYIDQYKELAMAEQRRSGVPAAITLAQGVHETSAGASELATNANNHFGIKCKKEWKGMTYAYTDDAPNECFRKYEHPVQSYKDHSDYLVSNKRYAALFALANTDYKGWAAGLKRCGYATNPKYAQILIKIIEDYHLQDYTYAALKPTKGAADEPATMAYTREKPSEIVPEADASPVASTVATFPTQTSKKNRIDVSYEEQAPSPDKKLTQELLPENPATPEYDAVVRINDLKAFYAKKGTLLLNDAIRHNMRYAKLLELNDLPDAPLEADMYVYLEKKHTTGNAMTYVVKPGETLLQIAQKEGMQLKYLKAYNKIGGNEEPVPGATLQLIEYATKKPATYARSTAPPEKKQIATQPAVAKATTPQGNFITKEEISKQSQEPGAEETTAVQEELNNEPVAEVTPKDETPTTDAVPPPAESDELSYAINEVAAPADTAGEALTSNTSNEHETASKEIEALAVAIGQNILQDSVKNQEAEHLLASLTIPVPVINELPPASQVPVDTADQQNSMPAAVDATIPVATNEPAASTPVPEESKPKTEGDKPSDTVATPPTGPEDEFSKLKAKLDKVVYSSDHISSTVAVTDTISTVSPKEAEAVPVKEEPKFYTVKKGDTAFGIAKKHKLTMRQLLDLNGLDFKAIRAGQKLKVSK